MAHQVILVFQELAERPELAAVAEPLRRHPETAAEVAVAAAKNKTNSNLFAHDQHRSR
jgi:hypothetical protein